MSIQLQEIQSIYISQNRLVEGKDYVRAEWLIGDGSAYIDTKHNTNEDLDWSTRAYLTYPASKNCRDLFWYRFDSNNTNAVVLTLSNNSTYSGLRVGNNTNEIRVPIQSDIDVEVIWNSQKVNINGVEYSATKQSPISYPFMLFRHRITDTVSVISSKDVKCNYFKLGDVLFLTPCQLLRDIPATLDANNIARTAGECGMIDSISGKFYGNVASSGSFTVENVDESGTVEDTRLHQIYTNKLVEGEDYMLGEQLATIVGNYSQGGYLGAYLNLPTDYQQFSAEFTLKTISEEVSSDLTGEVLVAFASTQGVRRFWKNKHIAYTLIGSNTNTLYDFGVVENDIIVQITQSQAIVNEVATTRVTTSNPPICNIGVSNRALKYTNIIKVTQDNNRIFVPCKLLRSIPRNLDAQCKSRSAGECGMIDLISGRFYGNVADSGVFSLEWDEWLKDCSIQLGQLPYSINTIPPRIEYYTRIKVSKLTAEYQDFGFCKLSLTKIAVGLNYPQEWDFSDWGTSEWATVVISYMDGSHATCYVNNVNVTGAQTTQISPIYQNVHIMLGETMQLSKIIYKYTIDTSDILGEQIIFTRYVDENTGQQGLISDQDGTIIYAD